VASDLIHFFFFVSPNFTYGVSFSWPQPLTPPHLHHPSLLTAVRNVCACGMQDCSERLNLGTEAADGVLKRKLEFPGSTPKTTSSSSHLPRPSAVSAAAAAAVIAAASDAVPPGPKTAAAAAAVMVASTVTPSESTAILVGGLQTAEQAPNNAKAAAPPTVTLALPQSKHTYAPMLMSALASASASRPRSTSPGPAAKKAKTSKATSSAGSDAAAARSSPKRKAVFSSRRNVALTERQQIAMVLKESRREEILLNINKRNSSGETALHQEVIKGDAELVAFLIEHKAPLNTKDYAGWSPLHEACNHGFFAIAQILIENGADVCVNGADKVTPLHDAAMNAHLDIVKLLIKSGAKVNALNKQKMTPIDVTSAVEVIAYLESKGGENGPKRTKALLQTANAAHAGSGLTAATPRQLSHAHVLSPPKLTASQLLVQQEAELVTQDEEKQQRQQALQHKMSAQLKAASQAKQFASHASRTGAHNKDGSTKKLARTATAHSTTASTGGGNMQRKRSLQLARGSSNQPRSHIDGPIASTNARHQATSSIVGSTKRLHFVGSNARAVSTGALYGERSTSTPPPAATINTPLSNRSCPAVSSTASVVHAGARTPALQSVTCNATPFVDAAYSSASRAAAAAAVAAADLSRSTKATRRNLVPVQPKLAADQNTVTTAPSSHAQFMINTRDYVETRVRSELANPTHLPAGVPPGLAPLFREQERERATLTLSMCREIDTMRMTYERDVARVYHDTQQCLSGRVDVSYFETNKTLEFVMGKDGRYVVDIAGTLVHVHARHQQAAAEIAHRHQCDAITLAAMQMLAWSQKSRASPVVPEVVPPVVQLIQ
jgi:hypothetical protein